MRRILVYGFGPYGTFQSNVTETVVRGLRKRRGLRKIVFPVKFHRGQFVRAIKGHEPDWVLGLGQCPRGKRLRIETQAANEQRRSKGKRATSIVPRGARYLTTTLRPARGKLAGTSRDAGRFVCNYSMYVILDFLRKHRPQVRFGFIHIPHDYNPTRVVRYLDRILLGMGEGR